MQKHIAVLSSLLVVLSSCDGKGNGVTRVTSPADDSESETDGNSDSGYQQTYSAHQLICFEALRSSSDPLSICSDVQRACFKIWKNGHYSSSIDSDIQRGCFEALQNGSSDYLICSSVQLACQDGGSDSSSLCSDIQRDCLQFSQYVATKKAAEQGDAKAQYNIGLMYYEGKGDPKDYKEASNQFKKVAEQGYVAAQEWIKKNNIT